MHRILVCFAALVLALVSSEAMAADQPRYVFLFIGDGMGPNQRLVANLASEALHGKPLLMESFPVHGRIQTRSANNVVTDSAAAGTALAAGVKTDNGMLGQLPDGTPVQSIAQRLSDAGFRTGVITSVQLNHATPAAFYSHVPKRAMYNEIAEHYLSSSVHLLIGNGMNSPNKKQEEIQQAWRDGGIAVRKSLDDPAPADQRLVTILNYPVAREEKLRDGPGQLADSVTFAIERLGNERGFFMMVEGGKIDWECHGNWAGEAIEETFAMDRAMQVAEAFRQQHPDDTLIVVTADHETGGMRLHEDRFDPARLIELTVLRHSADQALEALDSLTLEGARQVLAETLKISNLTDKEVERLAKVLERNNRGLTLQAIIKIAQDRAGITWTTNGHTGVDVPVTAIGAGAQAFEGEYDNTEIPLRILKLMLPESSDAP